jgi:hypothetical protein
MRRNTVEVIVDSYKVKDSFQLTTRASKRTPEPRRAKHTLTIYKDWLKKYLDFFNPGFYDAIMSQLIGTKVLVLPNELASHRQEDYEQQGKTEYHHEVVPLNKAHNPVFLDDEFLKAYAPPTEVYHPLKIRSFDSTYARECNPLGVSLGDVPFPKCKITTKDGVPNHHYQITGIRAEIQHMAAAVQKQRGKRSNKAKGLVLSDENLTVRWLGIQNEKYVGLPYDWVVDNISEEIRKEAIERGKAKLQGKSRPSKNERFVRLPPGDVRQDDPPLDLRDVTKGLNYYYQEMYDNCLMGGLANAVFRMKGWEDAALLLRGWKPLEFRPSERWSQFQEHVMGVKRGVRISLLKSPFTLQCDDSCPIVLQLRGNDGSETHAVTVYKNNIYDSASRFVLLKNKATMDWCCGQYGYQKALRAYKVSYVSSVKQKHKKRSRYT